MNEKIISAADMMLQAANINIATSEANEICSVWRKVVSSVHSFKHDSQDSDQRMPLGERLAGNTRVIDLRNGVLLVESDHPGWIQYLRMYQKYILNGLKMNLPKLNITNLAFRVAGEKVSLSETYEQQLARSRKEMEQKFEEQEEQLKKYEKKARASEASESAEKQGSELPPELLAKFDSIRQSMLTNSDNK